LSSSIMISTTSAGAGRPASDRARSYANWSARPSPLSAPANAVSVTSSKVSSGRAYRLRLGWCARGGIAGPCESIVCQGHYAALLQRYWQTPCSRQHIGGLELQCRVTAFDSACVDGPHRHEIDAAARRGEPNVSAGKALR